MKNTGTEYKTMLGTFNSADGDLRLLNVTAGRGGKSYMSYQKVPQRLEDFCNWINAQRKTLSPDDIDKIYKISFMAHYNLVYIHPWADGNGRMSRLVMNMIQAEFGVIPSIDKKENREEYIKSLTASQEEGNPDSFIEFMLKHHIANLEKTITEYNQSIENDTLNLENDTLNDTLNLSAKETLILNLIKADNHITITDLINKSGFSRPTITRAISSLKERNIIDRAGAKKNGHWIIIE